MKTFIIGDIHGGYKALQQVFKRASFDYEKDRLICLGDVSDGWTETAECFEELLKIKNLVYVLGNHDKWLLDWLKTGEEPLVWVTQGGANTLLSYERHPEWKEKHLKFLEKAPYYYLDEQKRVFVHGGIDISLLLDYQDPMYMMWDRTLLSKDFTPSGFKEIYVGHTSIYRLSDKPMCKGNIWFMDTGGGWEGVLSMMDIDTKDIHRSVLVKTLYPDVSGRN